MNGHRADSEECGRGQDTGTDWFYADMSDVNRRAGVTIYSGKKLPASNHDNFQF
jgi:hypothetical protein